jgi:Flagellar hook-length control protein FliK
MINLSLDKQLSILLPNTNKALAEVLKSASPQELATLTKGKDLSSILDGLLKQSAQESSQDKALLNLLKNNPTLKDLGSVTSTIKDLHQSLQQDKNPLPLEKVLKSFLGDIKNVSEKDLKAKIENSGVFLESKIKNVESPKVELKSLMQELSKTLDASKLPNVKEINAQLKQLLSSDIFKNISNKELTTPLKVDMQLLSELTKKTQSVLTALNERQNSPMDKALSKNDTLFSKETTTLLDKIGLLNKPEKLQMQTRVQELFSNDLKAVLLKSSEELQNSQHPNKQELLKQMDKLALQIDYFQLSSHLANASSLYVPYSWDALNDGNITIKKAGEDKFFCDIELNLKEYGELKLRLGMFEKNQLNINITTYHQEFKAMIKENLPELRQQLIDIGITPKEIRFLDETNTGNAYDNASRSLDMGFEVKA